MAGKESIFKIMPMRQFVEQKPLWYRNLDERTTPVIARFRIIPMVEAKTAYPFVVHVKSEKSV